MEPLYNIGHIHDKCADDRQRKWQKENKTTIIQKGYYVKKAFSQGNKIEHMWIKVTSVSGSRIEGTLDNDPHVIKTLKCGSIVTFERSEISELLK